MDHEHCLSSGDAAKRLINLAYVGTLFLVGAVLSLGMGLIRTANGAMIAAMPLSLLKRSWNARLSRSGRHLAPCV